MPRSSGEMACASPKYRGELGVSHFSCSVGDALGTEVGTSVLVKVQNLPPNMEQSFPPESMDFIPPMSKGWT
jgi:hypothetical protein